MITYQDFESATNKEKFIVDTIKSFTSSAFFNDALISRRYYAGDNDILERMQYFWASVKGSGSYMNGDLVDERAVRQVDTFKANNTISNNFYKKIIMQEKSYLLANGVGLDEMFQGKIKKLDYKIQKVGENSLLDGTSFVYAYKDEKNKFKINSWSGLEFIPLYDEKTGNLRAGIRFYNIDIDKPTWVELYEIDGITEYSIVKDKITLAQAKRDYTIIVGTDILGTKVIGGKNWSKLPIIEVKSDASGKPRLSNSIKSKVDLYDVVMSDFGNNLEDSRDVYWVLKNYGGQGMEDFLKDYKHYKTIKIDGDSSEGGSDATPHTIEIPYQARKIALEKLRSDIYDEAMAVDITLLSGGSLTSTHIKASMNDLDLKTDAFEEQIAEAVDDILELYEEYVNGMGIEVDNEYQIKFIRRTLVNDTETIDNIVKSAMDLDLRTRLELNPLVDNKNINEIMLRLEEESQDRFDKEVVEVV
jgi:hypothetical protein